MGQSNTATTQPDTSHTPQLNWKVIRRSLPLTLFITALLTALYLHQLFQLFDGQRSNDHSLHHQIAQQILLQSEQPIKILTRTLQRDEQLLQYLVAADKQRLFSHFNSQWTQVLQYSTVSFIGFYALDGAPLVLWPKNSRNRDQQLFTRQWLEKRRQSSQNLSAIYCQERCARFQFSTLGSQKKPLGYLVIASRLDETLNQFPTQQHKPSGLLTPALHPESSVGIIVYKRDYALHEMSGDNQIKPLLQKITAMFPAIEAQHRVLNTVIDQQHFELSLYPLNLSDNSLLAIISNNTQALHAIYSDTALFALLLLIALCALSFAIIHLHTKFIASFLTLSHELDTAETEPPELSTLSPLQPECSTAISHDKLFDVSSKNKEQHNEDINQELTRKMICLENERDRMQQILDNSQAIIMTLYQDGTIASMNRYGEKITGFSGTELKGKNFIDLYPENMPFALNDLQNISSITQGHRSLYQHEANLFQKGGNECIIQWSHSLLVSDDSQGAILLSTGLDITQYKKLEKNLRWLANHDSLTSLFNRRRFEKELESAVLWAKKHQADGILITIDLGNFRDINDACGHKVGDIILRKVANTLKELTRQIDPLANKITARLGGDEFAIILRNIDKEGACLLSRRIIEALQSITHFHRQISFQLSASIGIATFSEAGNNATELLSNANYARNKAKVEGRNQHLVFSPEHSQMEQTHHRMIWRDRIENALKNDRFVLHFQPILNIQQNTISHYETLIRMLDENNKLVAPSLFIHLAEKFGLIQQIDNYIIASAIAKQGELNKQGHDVTLTLNLSAKVFADPQLYRRISHAIQLNSANPKRLIFEITETGAVSDITLAQKIMTRIQALGCQFALDDFGVGFSSFNYLRRLPVDFIKIDGSFISNLADNSDNEVLVKALSEVAIGFNKFTVAEFVDSNKTLDILKMAKINFAQGYFIGKPSETIPVETPAQLYSPPPEVTRLH